MNKKERTLRALQGLPVDRPPMVFWHHFVGEDMRPENFAASHVRFYRETDEDFIKMMCDGYVALPDIQVASAKDWAHIKLPKMTDSYVQEQLAHIQRVREGIQDETAVFYNVFNAVSAMRSSTSGDLVYAHLKEGSTEFFAGISAVNQFKMEFAQKLVETAGVTGIFLPMQNNEKGQFNGNHYWELLRPYDLKLIEWCNSLSQFNIVHLCGYWGIPNNLENWRDFPAAAIHWDVHTDHLTLAQGREFFSNKKAVMGGFNNKEGSVIYTASREAIINKTQEIIQRTGDTGLIISSDCSLLEDVEHSRVRWVREGLERWKERKGLRRLNETDRIAVDGS